MSPILILLAGLLFQPLQDAPSNPAKLTLTMQPTFGALGPVRHSARYSPRDHLYVRIHCSGLTQDRDGKVNFGVRMSLRLPTGQEVPMQQVNLGTVSYWRENHFSLPYHLPLELNQAPGAYTLICKVLDQYAATDVTCEMPFEVQPMQFALLGPLFYFDNEAKVPAGPSGIVGQKLFVNIGVVGHLVQPKQSKVLARMHLLDAQGKTIHEIQSEPMTLAEPVLGFAISFDLLKAGEFTMRFTVVDELANRTLHTEVPLKVREP